MHALIRSHLILTTPCGRCHYKPIGTNEEHLAQINHLGRVTHLINDCTIIIINGPLEMQPNL